MVEIPVFPNNLKNYKELLLKLDKMRIFGINLIEAVYTFRNSKVFKTRGYKIFPENILWKEYFKKFNSYFLSLLYLGLPIFKSAETCMDLIGFSLKKGLNIGLHYCYFKNRNLKGFF